MLKKLSMFVSTVTAATLISSGFFSPTASAEVKDSNANGFTLSFVKSIDATPELVYRALTQDIGYWWLDAHTWYGSGKNMTLADHVGGCLCEISGDKQTLHMIVAKLEPNSTVRLLGGLGPLQGEGLTGVMNWNLSSLTDNMTQLTVTYRVGGYSPHDLSQWAAAVDGVLQEQMSAMKNYVEQPVQ